MTERRRSRRRSLPFVRSGVLEVDGRGHIVVVTDLSEEGAFLATRVPVAPGQSLRLRMVVPRDGHEVAIPCKLVRHIERLGAASGRPAGLAVRFTSLDADVAARIRDFSREGLAPAAEPAPADRYEHRILFRPELEVDELNRLGLDGWRLVAALPSPDGVRMILVRRL